MIGADICGFSGDTTEYLCSVWTELGTFYPFFRNHNKLESIEQKPWSFSQKHLLIVRNAINFRYGISRYQYTCLFYMSLNV